MSTRDKDDNGGRDPEGGSDQDYGKGGGPGTKQEGSTKTGTLKPQRTDGKLFPPYRVKEGKENEVRAPRPPTAKSGGVEKQSPTSHTKKTKAGGGGADDPVKFLTYSPTDTATGATVSDNAADISGAQNLREVVMHTGNWYCDLSVDAGSTWKRFDPTTLFPNNLGASFCCDQIVHYVPSIDRFIWFMQHTAGADGSGVFRIAVASPANMKSNFAAAWTYWDFHADDFGLKGHDFDYPDLAFTNQFLHLCTDDQTLSKLLVCRIPLQDLAAGGSINFRYNHPNDTPGDFGTHLAQNGQHAAFWAGHKDNATLWVFRWADSSDNYGWTAVPVSKYPNGTLSGTSPGGVDWLTKLNAFPAFGVIGATRSGNSVWFAWTASSGQADPGGPTYKNAHVRVAQVDIGTMKTTSEIQIWNNDYAFAYPSLNTNQHGDVGIALGWGGKSNNANAAVGILGDFVVWYENGSETATKRWGDYVTCRSTGGDSQRFAGFGYYIKKDSTRTSGYYFDPYYGLFGRS
ncbi:MAG: hypothetical protein NVSMB3_09780 [Acidobacteriaceae bacterium]